ncbi:hypothetical protein J3E68DRAFT_401791 [Trichoderma sp. SZMC 28012]
MFLPRDSPQLRGFSFFSSFFLFVNVATFSIPPVVVHQFMKTPSHALLFICTRVPSAISGLFGSMEPWAARNWPQLLGSEASTYPTKRTLLDMYKQMHPARQNDLHEHEPTSRLDLISCVCKVWQAVCGSRPTYVTNLGAFSFV